MSKRDRKEIVDAFERIERMHGGYAHISSCDVLDKVAAEIGVTFERARAVMLDEWDMRNSG